MDITHSPVWREVLIVSGVSFLNFSTLRNLLRLLRSSIGLHLLFGFGTKIVSCKTPNSSPTLLHFCSSADAMPPTGRSSCGDLHGGL